MARNDWEYINLPKEMFNKIKKLSEDPEWRSNGFVSPRDVLTEIIRDYFKKHNIK